VLVAAGCKVDTTVSIKVNDDGSGVVTVTAVLDAEAVKTVESGGGKLEDRIRLSDLTASGWTVHPWLRAADGSAQIVLSKPFASPAQFAQVMQEVSGKVGPLRDLTLTRDHGLLSTHYEVTGDLDLTKLETGVLTDPEVVAQLTNQQVDVAALDQSLIAEIRDSLDLRVEVHLPDGSTTVSGTVGKTSPIDASSSVLDTRRVGLIVVALVLLALAVLFLIWPGSRRRRRRRRSGTRSGPSAQTDSDSSDRSTLSSRPGNRASRSSRRSV
jgi:hypothetical protein